MKISLLIISLILVYFRLFLPGIHVANDLHLLQRSEMLNQLSPPYTWENGGSVGLGEYSVPFLWSWLPNTFSGILTYLNVSYSVKLIILPLLPIISISFIGINKLLQYCEVNSPGKYIGIFFYLSNTYILLLIDGGQLNLAVTYAILPLSFYLYRIYIDKSNVKSLLKFCISLISLSLFDIRIIYLLALLIIVDFIFESLYFKETPLLIKRYFILSVSSLSLLLLFHLYWILPAILSKQLNLPTTYERSAQVNFLSFATLSHAIFFIQPHWFKNIFGEVAPIKWYFALIPLLVFSSPILKKKYRWVGFYLLIAIVSIFLIKGSNEPLPNIYNWLFVNIPAFNLFRDPTKFYFLQAIAYSILLGYSVEKISNLKIFFLKKDFFNKSLMLVLFLYLLWLSKPTFLGQMTGMFNNPIFEKEYLGLAKILQQDKEFGRVFWIPYQQPLSYSDALHPTIEATRLSQLRPFAVGIKGSYETFNFLREASFMGELFDVAGISYIAYPYLDPRRDNLHPDNIKYYYTFLNQLYQRLWVTKINSPILLLKTTQHQDLFNVAPNIWWVIGSDDIYNESTKSASLKLSKNALIFAEEFAGLGEKINLLPQAKIVLNNKTLTDLSASFIDKSKLIFPASQLNFDPDQSGWWKREAVDLVKWKAFLQEKYGIDNQDFDLGGGWAVGEGNLKLKVKSKKLKVKKGDILLARVMESSRSGILRFSQGSYEIGGVKTQKNDTNIRWFEIGQIAEDKKDLQITSSGDINVVNALAILDSGDWIRYQEKAKSLQNRVVDFSKENINKSIIPQVTYQRINPTKYKVHITNLTQSMFLVFSQNFDDLWKMNGQSSLPVYSLLNGFKVERDGEYIVEFEPQKYVYPGLIISGVTILILMLLFLKSSRFPTL